MQALIEYLKAWQLHPVVDHFTVALIVVAVLVDLAASLLWSRFWLRYMALTLLILGTASAFASQVTGGWEAERIWDSLSGPGKELLKRHGWWGHYLPYAFLVLALWRIIIQFAGFAYRTRPIYLIVAIIGLAAILYQGDLGGDLVYDYGAGTALLQAAATPVPESSAPPLAATPIPTVYVPSPTPAASPSPITAAPFAATPASAAPSPAVSTTPSPAAEETPSAEPDTTKNL